MNRNILLCWNIAMLLSYFLCSIILLCWRIFQATLYFPWLQFLASKLVLWRLLITQVANYFGFSFASFIHCEKCAQILTSPRELFWHVVLMKIAFFKHSTQKSARNMKPFLLRSKGTCTCSRRYTSSRTTPNMRNVGAKLDETSTMIFTIRT